MDGSISISWAWAIGLICLACGIAGGVLVTSLFSGGKRRTEELEQQLADK